MQVAVASAENLSEVAVSFACCPVAVTLICDAGQAELTSVASALRGLNNDGDQSAAAGVTQELAVLFESFSSMLARNASASASSQQAAASAGAAAALLQPSSPYKTLAAPSQTPFSAVSKSSAEVSFLTISREVEVSVTCPYPWSHHSVSVTNAFQALRLFAAQTLMNSSSGVASAALPPAAVMNPSDPRPYLVDSMAYLGPESSANMVQFCCYAICM